MKQPGRALVACSFLLLLHSDVLAGPSDAEDPSSPGPLVRLQTGPAGMHLSFPGSNGREVSLSPEDAITAGTPERGRLTFEARLTAQPNSPVRLVFHAQNKQGWFYQTSTWAIPFDRWRRIDVDFSPDSDVWEAAGHARPWDSRSAQHLTRIGLRLFCETQTESTLLIRSVHWEQTGREEPQVRAQLVDLNQNAHSIDVGELWEVSFRTTHDIADWFDPGQAALSCEIVTPMGRTHTVRCFIYQEYARYDRRLVAVGAPQWRARFRPAEKGRFRYRILAAYDSPGAFTLAAEGWFNVDEAAQLTADTRTSATTDDGRALEDFIVDLAPDSRSGWRPELTPRRAVWSGVTFQRDTQRAPTRAWRPMLEWTRSWGLWEGLGSYDLELAWRFDHALRAAERAGITLPLAIVDDGPFLDHGTYRWPKNPLSEGEGGPLAGPGQFFTSEEARTQFLRKLRYLVARFGDSPAISSWCIASGLAAPGATQWHEFVGRQAAALGIGGPGQKPLISLHPFAAPFRNEVALGEFEEGEPAGWRLDEKDSAGAMLARSDDGAGAGSALAMTFPPSRPQQPATSGDSGPQRIEHPHLTVYRPLDDSLFDFDYLTFDVRMPASAKTEGRAQIIVRDRDLLWYEYLLETPLRPGDWSRCVVDLTTRGSRFRPVGHVRPWNGYTRSRIRQIAVRVFPNSDTTQPALLDHVKLYSGPRAALPPLELTVLDAGGERVEQYDRQEMILSINEEFPNPFDPDAISIDAVFTHEGTGVQTSMPAFFYEPYERRIERRTVSEYQGKKREVEVERDVEILDVRGAPDWRVRFAPTRPGRYSTRITARTPDREVTIDGPAFICVKSDRRGYVRVASDNRYFEFTTGQVYYPIGPVMRSPNDVRDMDRDQSIREDVLKAGWLGTYQFDEYFKALEKSKSNWIRMWMCSWWCGLEWYHEWPGYGGTGVFNMANAWRLDHVLEEARARGVYVQLCLQNHGQTSERIDHEWEYHPYNRYLPEAWIGHDKKDVQIRLHPAAKQSDRYLRKGGWLTRAEEFYSDARARKARKTLYRYLVARWGYSTSLLAWVLSSELEFTGEYQRVQYGADDHDMSSGRWPDGIDRAKNTKDWHREMATYLREIDSGRHLVTTHFSHPHRGRGIWPLKELSYAQSNAYTAFGQMKWFHGPKGPQGCVPVPMAMEQYYERFLGRYHKPVLVSEWGGHWMRNPTSLLEAELHAGTWASIMTPMAGSTGFWWWSHVHFRHEYGVFTAVGRFLEGEDRRNKGLEPVRISFVPKDRGLEAVALGNRTQADVYVYHVDHTFKQGSAPKVKGVTMAVPGLANGLYRVEIWNTDPGRHEDSVPAVAAGGVLRFELPVIEGDLALKIRPAK